MKLFDAMVAADARKAAVFDDEVASSLTEQECRSVFIGTDIDAREAWTMAEQAATAMVAAVVLGKIKQSMALQSAWVDGVLTGVLFAQGVAREDREADRVPRKRRGLRRSGMW